MTLTPDQNPDQVFPGDLFTSKNLPGRWRIARTRSRREKALAVFLRGLETPYYLPMFRKRQPGSKRERYSLVPVFGGYVFFKATELDRHRAFACGHIASVIEVVDEQGLVRDLERISRALTLDVPVYPYDFVSRGDLVEIVDGPFKGMQGVIQRKAKSYRLVLNVESIFKSLALDIEAHMVRPLAGSAA